MRMQIVIGIAIAAALPVAAPAQQAPAGAAAAAAQSSTSPYAPYEFLIGDWISTEGPMTVRQSFRWGPAKSYIFYSTFTRPPGRPEALHFEGIMVWNANSKALDYVFAIEPGSGGQEKGTVRAQADGSIVREVELTRPDGKIRRFRQTFRKTGADTAVTSLMQQTDKGWEPNFPGSQSIPMMRPGQ